ncbi:kinesin-like protein KIN-7L [Dendrobium catenatum]|uniref:Kinesin-like protein n=1 Tax=Dendrobium catenatum TaxID=906689 RepID=A0A2I0X6E7_9ASPA|nr:kinesin-like protein KIN-7L [Dendrobium catenatum]PKU83466.1 Kinesin-like protein NACK2 [Dendrobium catenatum]
MEKISVAVRFRPSIAEEAAGERQWRIEDNRISLHRPLGTPISGISFAFDHVFEQSSTNASVYDILIKSIIQAAINGFNGTAFAYGQTSSGKTFTMNGSQLDPGIIPQAVRDIFDTTHMITDREFLVRVSYMEIYNEEINDLLSLGNQRLPVHESLERGVYVAGLREEIVNSADQVLELIKLGEANRHVGETNMNVRSSRSHTIFRMVIESSAKDSTSSVDAIRVSVLNLVDLAGSERIAKTGAGGVRLKEGKHINKSLMILGNVINKLSENGKHRAHIPYRDSKLTRILQPALGGNAKTSIICTVAPEEVHIEETKGTLQFASRAKRITNCAQVNEVLTDAALLKRQKQEIEELRRKLQGQHSEVLEQVILKQRNDMHKSELEREKLAMELEEERKSRQALEHHMGEQQRRIDYLNELLASNDARKLIQGTVHTHSSYEEMSSRNCMSQGNTFTTPIFKAMPDQFVVKRSNHSKAFDSSPLPENFTNTANEDLWLQLNKGFRTDLDALQMTPNVRYRAAQSNDTSIGTDLEEWNTKERCLNLASECKLQALQVDALKEQYDMLERKYSQLREENSSLVQTLSYSNHDVVLLKAQKDELQKDLNYEREKMRDLKEEIRLFGLVFAERECLLNSLYSKSKTMIENFSSSQII